MKKFLNNNTMYRIHKNLKNIPFPDLGGAASRLSID